MALSFRAASGGNGGATTTSPITVALPAGWQAGDLVYLSISMFSTAATFTVPTGWAVASGPTSNATSAHQSIVIARTMQAGDTLTSVAFTGSGGKRSYSAIALAPAAGSTAAHSGAATVVADTTAATTSTPTAYAAGALSGASVVFFATKANANVATAITQAPATNWTEPTNGDQSTAVGTTAGTRQVGSHVQYRLAQTGTITPPATTVNQGGTAVFSQDHHLFAVEVAPAVSTLTSTFDTLPAAFTANVGTPTVTGGQLVADCLATYEAAKTAAVYTFAGSSVFCEVVQIAGTSLSRQNSLKLEVDATNSVEMMMDGGVFRGRVTIAGANTDVALPAYDAAAHRWWRLRESGGTVFFDAAPDGATWTNLGSVSRGTLNVSLVAIALQAGHWNAADTGGQPAIYDNLNTTSASAIAAPTMAGATTTVSSVINTGDQVVLTPFTPAAGEVVVAKFATSSKAYPTAVVDDQGNAWTQRVTSTPANAAESPTDIWTTTAGAAAATTVTATFSSDASGHVVYAVVERYSGAALAATPTTNHLYTQAALSSTITTTRTNSVVTWVSTDWNVVGGTPAYLSGAVESAAPYRPGAVGAYTAYQTAANLGVQTYGFSAPTGQWPGLTALEIMPAAASVTGTSAAISPAATSAAASSATTTGATAGAAPAATSAASAANHVTGTSTATGPTPISAATGTEVQPASTGTVTGTAPAPTNAATASARTTATGTSTATGATSAATGSTRATGAATGVAPAVTSSASATAIPPVTGTTSSTAPAVTSSAAGTNRATGTSTAATQPATSTGAAATRVTGSGSSTSPTGTTAVAASAIDPYTGTAASTAPAATSSGSVTGRVTGTSASTSPTASSAATSTGRVTGTVAHTAPSPSSAIAGQPRVDVVAASIAPSPTTTTAGTAGVAGSATNTAPAAVGAGTDSTTRLAAIAHVAPAAQASGSGTGSVTGGGGNTATAAQTAAAATVLSPGSAANTAPAPQAAAAGIGLVTGTAANTAAPAQAGGDSGPGGVTGQVTSAMPAASTVGAGVTIDQVAGVATSAAPFAQAAGTSALSTTAAATSVAPAVYTLVADASPSTPARRIRASGLHRFAPGLAAARTGPVVGLHATGRADPAGLVATRAG